MPTETNDRPALGMLQLMNTPVVLPGAISNPDSFDFPMRYRQVPEAWGKKVVGESLELQDAYIAYARQMESDGAAALTTNCGFTAKFQPAVAEAVSIPVGLSSLLLVPLMAGLLPPGRKLGIVTADATKLTEVHFNGAGWSRGDLPVEIVGIEGSEASSKLSRPDPKVTVDMLERDVVAATRKLIEAHPEVASLVLECSAFPIVADAVRRETGLPAVDFSTLANLLMAAVSQRADLVSAARRRANTAGTLGLLRLNHGQIELPGAIGRPDSFSYPVRYRPVPGAWAQNVTRGDRSVVPAYVECARTMEHEGCTALITTCGFTSLFQQDFGAAVTIPFAGSSLLLMPFIERILPPDAKIALLTYDAECLTDDHCKSAGFSLADERIVVAGVEGDGILEADAGGEPRSHPGPARSRRHRSLPAIVRRPSRHTRDPPGMCGVPDRCRQPSDEHRPAGVRFPEPGRFRDGRRANASGGIARGSGIGELRWPTDPSRFRSRLPRRWSLYGARSTSDRSCRTRSIRPRR